MKIKNEKIKTAEDIKLWMFHTVDVVPWNLYQALNEKRP